MVNCKHCFFESPFGGIELFFNPEKPIWFISLINIEISSFAGREGRTDWPHADGVIEVNNISNQKKYNLAIEYKRPNEGLHGILTAVGQSHAYLQKGYSGSFMVLPKNYNNFDTGNYVKDLIENTSQSKSIGICLYERPNSNNESPFKDKLEIILPCDNMHLRTKAT